MMSKPDYSTHDQQGWCGDASRGAAMGRPTVLGPAWFGGQIRLRRSYLDNGGYDSNGTYFGIGSPLYWYASDDGEIDGMTRGSSRAEARAYVLSLYPLAKVRR